MKADAGRPDENPAPSRSRFDWAPVVAEARQGNETAARQIVRDLYPLIIYRIRLCQPRLTSEEDLAQMIFLKVFTHLPQYSGQHPFEHWVSRIAVNTCLSQIQYERSRPEWRWADLSEAEIGVLENLVATTDTLPAHQDLAARELAEKLLASLDSSDRLLMRLMYLQEKSIAEIQQLTGWSSVGIRVKALRARRKLKIHLDKLMKEGA